MPPISIQLLQPIYRPIPVLEKVMKQPVEPDYHATMRRLNISLIAPPMDPSDTSDVILIRHGLSNMNMALLEANLGWDDDCIEKTMILRDPKQLDAPLHPIGIM